MPLDSPGTPAPSSGEQASQSPGEDPVTENSTKPLYASQRILLPDGWPTETWFHSDRDVLAGQPGFHIFGLCPSCKHPMSGVCATEYLAQDEAGTEAGAEAEGHISGKEAWKFEEFRPIEQESLKRGARKRESRSGRKPFWRGGGVRRPPEGRVTQVTVLQCACIVDHQGAPAGTFGCGSQWLLRVTFNQGGSAKTTIKHVSELQAPYYWPAADAAAAEIPNSLSDAQATAKNWAAGLAAAIALLGVSGLLGNGKTIQALSGIWQFFFGLAAFVAVLAAALMIYQSTLAGYGSTRLRQALKPSDLRNADLDPLIEASASVRRLRRSVWATGVSVLAALAAAGILLFVSPPGAAPAAGSIIYPYPVKITYVTGGITVTTPCGVVQAPGSPGTAAAASLTLKPSTPPSAGSIPIELSEITATSGC